MTRGSTPARRPGASRGWCRSPRRPREEPHRRVDGPRLGVRHPGEFGAAHHALAGGRPAARGGPRVAGPDGLGPGAREREGRVPVLVHADGLGHHGRGDAPGAAGQGAVQVAVSTGVAGHGGSQGAGDPTPDPPAGHGPTRRRTANGRPPRVHLGPGAPGAHAAAPNAGPRRHGADPGAGGRDARVPNRGDGRVPARRSAGGCGVCGGRGGRGGPGGLGRDAPRRGGGVLGRNAHNAVQQGVVRIAPKPSSAPMRDPGARPQPVARRLHKGRASPRSPP